MLFVCIANVVWEKEMHLNVFANIQFKWWEGEDEEEIERVSVFSSGDKAHSMFVYKASRMYILYIVDLPNLCSVSDVVYRSVPAGCVVRTFVCVAIDVFSYVRFSSLCSSFQFPFPLSFFSSSCAELVLDELAYDGLSFRICAIKVFWVLYFAHGKALWMS